jgi:hypothetical protein
MVGRVEQMPGPGKRWTGAVCVLKTLEVGEGGPKAGPRMV